MQGRGNLYLASLLILVGLFLLAANLAGPYLGLGWGQLWPGFLALAALAFYLPIVVWWGRRQQLAGLAIPGTIVLANALIFFYNTLGRDWDAWRYLWTLEPLTVGLGLYAAWLAGLRQRGLLVGGHVLSLTGLLLFAVLGLILGGTLARAVAPFVLIGLGAYLLVRSVSGRPGPQAPAMPG